MIKGNIGKPLIPVKGTNIPLAPTVSMESRNALDKKGKTIIAKEPKPAKSNVRTLHLPLPSIIANTGIRSKGKIFTEAPTPSKAKEIRLFLVFKLLFKVACLPKYNARIINND